MSSAPTQWAAYNASNKVSSASTAPTGYSYDASGQILNDGVAQYLYNADGQICAVQQLAPDALVYGYIYDASGRRVAKGRLQTFSCDLSSPNTFTAINQYVYGTTGTEMTELDGNGQWSHTNVFAENRLLATYKSDGYGPHYVLSDWLGSKRVQLANNGYVESTWANLPYGNSQQCILCSNSDASDEHFTGKERDAESGLDNLEARYFGSSGGRFLSPDPGSIGAVVHMGDPQSWNGYSYARNNPLSFGDPSGASYTICDPFGANCSTVSNGNFAQIKKDAQKAGESWSDLGGGMSGTITLSNGAAGGTFVFNGRDENQEALTADSVGLVDQSADEIAMLVGGKAVGTVLGMVGRGISGLLLRGGETSAATFLSDVAMAKPLVTNAKLEAIVEKLYQPTDIVPGGTAGAVRYESLTGDMLSPAGHVQDAADTIREIQKLLLSDVSLSVHDQAVAKALMQDLADSQRFR